MILQVFSLLKSQPDTTTDTTEVELDLDALWENTIWEEIQEVTEVYGEVEQITAVAGVRGAEAEDEALSHLYYRRTMKGLSELEVQKALGKLIQKRDKVKDPREIDRYIVMLRNKLKKM